jgi:hypothetical protein
MEGKGKPQTDKYKIRNDLNYEAVYTFPSLPVWNSENFKRLIFIAQSLSLSTMKRTERLN